MQNLSDAALAQLHARGLIRSDAYRAAMVARIAPERVYYTLATRENGAWSPQFGDYSRSVVISERENYREHGFRRADLRVICSGAPQSHINAAVARLNRGAA